MITQKERILLIVFLILLLVIVLILSISIVNFVSRPVEEPAQVFEIQNVTEPESELEIETQPPAIQTEPATETEPTTIVEETQTEIDTEFWDFCMLTFAESGAECIEGQIAVAAVIINRKEDSFFPDTFTEVINQPNQFSPVVNGKIYSEIDSYEELPDKTIEAVERALEGEDPTEQLLWDEAVRLGLDPVKYADGGALYFYNPAYCDWQQLAARNNIKVKVRIGNHIFYKVWDT